MKRQTVRCPYCRRRVNLDKKIYPSTLTLHQCEERELCRGSGLPYSERVVPQLEVDYNYPDGYFDYGDEYPFEVA